MSTVEVAERLGLSRWGVQYHVRGGRLKARLVGRSLVYRPRDVEAFAGRRRPPGWPRRHRNHKA